MTVIISTAPPPGGFWRVGRSGAAGSEFRRPLRVDDTNQLGGNRFDSFTGAYGTLYFGTTLEVCFAETLARFRPKPELLALVDEEWDDNGWMRPGNIAADWRLGRAIQRSVIDEPLPFVDIDHPDTLATLNTIPELMAGLSRFGIEDLDLGAITGRDRRVTRFVAEFLYDSTDAEGQRGVGRNPVRVPPGRRAGSVGPYSREPISTTSSADRSDASILICSQSPSDIG
jgi:hypothetical protein